MRQIVKLFVFFSLMSPSAFASQGLPFLELQNLRNSPRVQVIELRNGGQDVIDLKKSDFSWLGSNFLINRRVSNVSRVTLRFPSPYGFETKTTVVTIDFARDSWTTGRDAEVFYLAEMNEGRDESVPNYVLVPFDYYTPQAIERIGQNHFLVK